MMINVTGALPNCPSCPDHMGVALEHQMHPGNKVGEMASGYWHCPIDHKVYIFQTPNAPLAGL